MEICKTKIAILLATYNGEKYLKEQLGSLLNQTEQDFSIFIHDDGSTDRTKNISEDYQTRFPNKITILEGAPTGGAKQNFMFLLSNVEANYYMFCDQDDYWKPSKIKDTFKIMITSGNNVDTPLLVFSDLEVVDSSLQTIAKSMNKIQQLNPSKTKVEDLLCQNNITGCTMMINRPLRDLSLKLQNINNIVMHDWWIALIAARYGKIVYCDKTTILYRQHGTNNNGAKNFSNPSVLIKMLGETKTLKKSISNTRLQAKEFCNCFGKNENLVIYQYSNLNDKNKIERLLFYKRNRIGKTGSVKKIGFILLG